MRRRQTSARNRIKDAERNDPDQERGQFLEQMIPVIFRAGDGQKDRDRADNQRYQSDSPPSRGCEVFGIPDPERKVESIFDRGRLGLPDKNGYSGDEYRKARPEYGRIGIGGAAAEGNRREHQLGHQQEDDPGAERIAKYE